MNKARARGTGLALGLALALAAAGSTDCLIGPRPGRACHGLGLQRLALGDGTTLWGKTGSDPGYFSAYFRTLSGSVSLFYTLAETTRTATAHRWACGRRGPRGCRSGKSRAQAAGTWTRKAMRVASWAALLAASSKSGAAQA